MNLWHGHNYLIRLLLIFPITLFQSIDYDLTSRI
jgi:hypothetical protein